MENINAPFYISTSNMVTSINLDTILISLIANGIFIMKELFALVFKNLTLENIRYLINVCNLLIVIYLFADIYNENKKQKEEIKTFKEEIKTIKEEISYVKFIEKIREESEDLLHNKIIYIERKIKNIENCIY